MLRYFKYFLFKIRRNKFIESNYKAEDPWSSALHLEVVQHFIKTYVKENHKILLDVGCGEGIHAKILKTITSRFIGIDISKTAIERAKKRNQSVENVFFINRDFDQIEKNKIKADIICFNFTLDYLGFQKFPMVFSQKLYQFLMATECSEVIIFNPIYTQKNSTEMEKYLFIFQNFSFYLKSSHVYDIGEYKINAIYLVKR